MLVDVVPCATVRAAGVGAKINPTERFTVTAMVAL